jgi:hypothetical protein
MNVGRGLMRLWVVGSALFILAIAALHGPEIVDEFKAAEASVIPTGYTELVPYNCAEARGQADKDYDKIVPNDPSDPSGNYCWYEIDKFRALYSEYADEDDHDLSVRLHEQVGMHIKTGRPLLKKWIAIALGGPFAILLLGVLFAWVIAGFRGARSVS